MLAPFLNRVGRRLATTFRPAQRADRLAPGPLAQDGRRPGEGPPDLDQMWQDFNARLGRLFGKNGDSGGPGSFRPDGRNAGPTLVLIGFVIAMVWLGTGIFKVKAGQTAVITTFGKVSSMASPGLNWRWPAPFQTHEIVNVSQLRSEEIGYKGTVRSKNVKEAQMLTDDTNIIDVQFAVQYTLNDPVAWLYNNRENDATVRQVAETAIREVVGRNQTDFVLNEGREKVSHDTRALMQQLVDRYKLGVLITNVTMQNVAPPEQVQSAFEDVNKASQDKAKAKNEGEAYANDLLPKAEGMAIRMVEDAEGYRVAVRENATGNASRFNQVVAEYQRAPAITRDRMYLDTMQAIFTSASKVMVDAKSNGNVVYLPLDKLAAQTATNDAAVGSKSGPVIATPPLPAELLAPVDQARQRDNRGRESSRDREVR
ncbi:MAG: FtsH protease activity modulator HflK [Massilia sp.]